MGTSVRCLSGLPGLTDALFHVCVLVPVSVCPIHTHRQILRGKGWHSRRRETHSNEPLIFVAKPRALCSVDVPLSFCEERLGSLLL